jgi:hypothetical protein
VNDPPAVSNADIPALDLLRAIVTDDVRAQMKALDQCASPDGAAMMISSLASLVILGWLDAGLDPLAVCYELKRRLITTGN